jgi:maltose alpha-D-glucosyltransferase/alpha-amylase
LIQPSEPLWYKDAIIYQIHVRAFYDSNDDGIGDFRGLTEKLDYLQDLGVTAIWLLPFFPSPLKDDGYDIADYRNVHANYGTLRDFRVFLHEAHKRGLRVITELVINHTSDTHPWFQRAKYANPGTRTRDFYVWNDTSAKYQEARIIFKDFEPSNWSWEPEAKAYYWHRFYAHQPDLNFDNPSVRREVIKALGFWLKMGVDGLRLDAIPYLYEREDTNCENLPETHEFLKEVRRHIDQNFQDRMVLAEANQWPEDVIAYFGQGDECHMAFHFPAMPRLFMALRMEDRYPIVDIMQQTPAIPETCQWAVFLRNHDELTLEMVTDAERDYMYRAYASDYQARINLGIRRRLAPLLGNDRRKIELLNGLLLALPGTPVIYYGDEIGMGDNFYLGDRNGVRTPMQWSADRNAGFSRANPQKLYLPVIIDPEYNYESVNVETQQNNPNSLLWWMKHLLSLRKRFKVFGRGSLEFLSPENRKILAFMRRDEAENVLVVANLSRFAQSFELELSGFKDMVPVELFGRSRFPPIGEAPYALTLTPHSFYWFVLEPQRAEVDTTSEAPLPALSVSRRWEAVFEEGRPREALETVLSSYFTRCRWFGGKARTIRTVDIQDTIPVPYDATSAYLALVQVEYNDGEPEIYSLPLAYTADEPAADTPVGQAAIARLTVRRPGRQDPEAGVLYDAMSDPSFALALLHAVGRGRRLAGDAGTVTPAVTTGFRPLLRSAGDFLQPRIMRAEQSNTSVVYGELFILKLFRRVAEGINPDLELGRYLTEKRQFPNIAPTAGALEYSRRRSQSMTLAILQSYLPNEGDAWQYTLDALGRYFHDVLARQSEAEQLEIPAKSLADLASEALPVLAGELIGMYLDTARLLGQRTGELHVALAEERRDPDFKPEPFTDFYRRGLYQTLISQAKRNFQLLHRRLDHIPDDAAGDARQVLDHQSDILARFQTLRNRRFAAMRIRTHGDYHLGQVLFTGKDFIIIDFEGEPARPVGERRLKVSPLRDVAGMLRSFHYAAYAPLLNEMAGLRPEDVQSLEAWARYWYAWVGATFLNAYTQAATGDFLPASPDDFRILLDVYLLDKAIYELGYELNNRPLWVRVPLKGILALL